jgi:hypothetical protein
MPGNIYDVILVYLHREAFGIGQIVDCQGRLRFDSGLMENITCIAFLDEGAIIADQVAGFFVQAQKPGIMLQ